ncbi:MAG: hypothetical protein AB7H90_05225 [Alphaproteobacteria bacterium]
MEQFVSKFIGSTSVLWIDVPDAPGPDSDRAYLERNLIVLLANMHQPWATASDNWLGRYSDRVEIRESGLWNVDHVRRPFDERSLDIFDYYVDVTLGRKERRESSLAPEGWRKSTAAAQAPLPFLIPQPAPIG